jgi:Na+-transporting methylmalonyl-CoA/oxaloacetate decarboxylase gamma subunit
MAKSPVVFIILLVVLVFISGCSTAEPKSVEPDRVERDRIMPIEVEPDESEPDKVPSKSEPNEVAPVVFEPNELQTVPATYFHNKCAGILKEFVNYNGMVDYKGLRRKRLELRALLREFNELDPDEYESWSREDKIAFWINVYNLQKLRVVTDNYPIEPSSRILTVFYRGTNNIRHIEEKITSHKFLVMDEEFTFATIEKRFFRGEFNDPRIFFAVSYACLSSPPLRNEPYYGHNLSEKLDEQTERFLSSPLAFSIDREKHKVYLSALFQSSWYGKEFIKKFAIDRKFKDQTAETRAVLNFFTNYISKEKTTFLETGNYTIKYMTFDWTINDGS